VTTKPRTLAADHRRCPGVQIDGEWREGCEDCLRRTSPPADQGRVWTMTPPTIVVFECQSRVAP
jgi:hypothetical protein